MRSIFRFCTAMMAALWGIATDAAESESMWLYCSPDHDLAWRTIGSSTVKVALTWPDTATKAMLSVNDAEGKAVGNVTAATGSDSCSWTAFTGDAPAADGCFLLKVTYYADDVELESESATLFLHKGTFAPVDAYSSSKELKFARTSSGRVVAYDLRWFADGESPLSMSVAERAGGETKALSLDAVSSGYLFWNPSRDGGLNGWYDFLLSCGGDSITGRALFGCEGTRITVR